MIKPSILNRSRNTAAATPAPATFAAEAFGRQFLDQPGATVECVAVFDAQAPAYCIFHSHATLELVHHLSGSGVTHLRSGQEFRYRPNDVVLYPPLMAHDQRSTRLGRDLCVQLRLPAPVSPPAIGLYVPPIADARLRAAFVSMMSFRPDANAIERAAMGHRATALLIELYAPGTSLDAIDAADDLPHRAYELLRARFDSIVTLADIAEELKISLDHLRHRFKQRYGRSMHSVVAELRLSKAKHLLAHSPLSLKVIAQACGFANERYLCHCFRQHTGRTPGSFRRGRTA